MRRFVFRDAQPTGDVHVFLNAAPTSGTYRTGLHDHDFYELMVVIRGTGRHQVNGHEHDLASGDIVLARLGDIHNLEVQAGSMFEMLNVAIPEHLWTAWSLLPGVEPQFTALERAPDVPIARIRADQQPWLLDECNHLLNAHMSGTSGLHVHRFLGIVMPLLRQGGIPDEHPSGEPAWLTDALALMSDERNLREGIGRLIELSSVSRRHLARVLREYRRTSPSALLGELRLQRATLLLASSSVPISDIALRCGFENLSYFHRCFRRRFGVTPRTYRMDQQGRTSVTLP